MRNKIFLFMVLLAMIVSVFAMPASGASQNLVMNGDFEEGNTGFTTQYIYLDSSNQGDFTLGWPPYYTVSTNPHLYHGNFLSFGDHTSGTGNMMIVNGATDLTPRILWEQKVTLPAYEDVSSYELFADQNWPIGEVFVKNDAAGTIKVKYVLTDPAALAEGWQITQAHVSIAENAAGIPNQNGNPIPGKFNVKEAFVPGVAETPWLPIDYNWTLGTPIVITMHAIVEYADENGVVQSKSAWGGTMNFAGKNWANYIDYTPCSDSYLLEFYAASNCNPVDPMPAQLEVKINGVVVGPILDLNPQSGVWVKYSAAWNQGSATSADIEIRDLRRTFGGDDFSIDDICLVNQ